MIVARSFALAALIAALAAGSHPTSRAAEPVQAEGVLVYASGVTTAQAESIARATAAARKICIEQFDFDMPATIVVNAKISADTPVRLFNDGERTFSLNVQKEDQLRQPSTSGVRHLYGLCHEVAHLAMYRTVQQRRWMTTAAAEGWAHYLGSRIIDEVWKQEGKPLWWEPYDYSGEGMARLIEQIKEQQPGEVVRGARLWMEWAEIVGDDKLAPLFAELALAEIDPQDPDAEIVKALKRVSSEPAIDAWWQRAKPEFVRAVAASPFNAVPPADGITTQIQFKPIADDGQPAGRRSTAGGGHAVRATAPTGNWLLTSVRVYGARYGGRDAGQGLGQVWICDAENREIAIHELRYDAFPAGKPGWAEIAVPPTLVPDDFIVGVSFNPTATHGVFVYHDATPEGHSFSSLPGREPAAFDEGDWLIRPILSLHHGPRTWNNRGGKASVPATLIAIEGDTIKLQTERGQIVPMPLSKFSDADQQYVQAIVERTSPGGAQAQGSPLATDGKPVQQPRPRMASVDDGRPAGRKSLPQGHAVQLESFPDGGQVTTVRIHGSRYGSPSTGGKQFKVALCTEDFQLIKQFQFPLDKFPRGKAKWVTLRLGPADVPERFVLCADFAATSTMGVFVSHDTEGTALVGKPGQPAGTFTGGDWLMRAVVAPRPPE